MRLIDADAVANKISKAFDIYMEQVKKGSGYQMVAVGAIHALSLDLANIPTIDAEPVVHAHWIHRLDVWQLSRHYIKCSKCGREYLAAKYKGELPGLTDEMIAVVEGHFPYCHCGAKMDEEVDDEKADSV